MRLYLAGLFLVLVPSLASAECMCTCVRGKATAICRPQALVEPICQQVCVDKIEQSLGTAGGGAGGALGGIGLGSGIGSTLSNGVGVDAGTGVGINMGDTGVVGIPDPSSGSVNSYERLPATQQLGR